MTADVIIPMIYFDGVIILVLLLDHFSITPTHNRRRQESAAVRRNTEPRISFITMLGSFSDSTYAAMTVAIVLLLMIIPYT